MSRISVLILGLLVAMPLVAQERINLSVAEQPPSNGQYRIERLTLTYDDPATTPADEGQVTIQLLGQNKEPVSCTYSSTSTPTATSLLNGLNKANLSSAYANNATTGSLAQRIHHRLVCGGSGMCESTARCGKALTGSLAGSVP